MAKWIADLDSDEVDQREAASAGLRGLGDVVRGALQKALDAGPSPEAKIRIEALVDMNEHACPTGVELGSIRGIEVLERIGTAEARSTIESLAGGARDSKVTRAASAALARLDSRR